MKSSGEELKVGDMVELDMVENMPVGGAKHRHFECKFIPDIAPLLLESGIITEEEVEDTNDADNSSEESNIDIIMNDLSTLLDGNKKLVEAITSLTVIVYKCGQHIKKLEKKIDMLSAAINEPDVKSKKDAKKTA